MAHMMVQAKHFCRTKTAPKARVGSVPPQRQLLRDLAEARYKLCVWDDMMGRTAELLPGLWILLTPCADLLMLKGSSCGKAARH